jgi:hypothetical protein
LVNRATSQVAAMIPAGFANDQADHVSDGDRAGEHRQVCGVEDRDDHDGNRLSTTAKVSRVRSAPGRRERLRRGGYLTRLGSPGGISPT